MKMNKKDMHTFAKILILLGIILCGFAQIIPWGEINVENGLTSVSQFYSWGAQTSYSIQDDEWVRNEEGTQINFYFMMIMNSSFINDKWNSKDRTPIILPVLITILILPLCLISLIFGYLDYRNFKVENIKIGYEAGICAVISIILFYLFIQFFIFPISPVISPSYSWSGGFYMMIFVVILFFSAYLIKLKADSIEQID